MEVLDYLNLAKTVYLVQNWMICCTKVARRLWSKAERICNNILIFVVN